MHESQGLALRLAMLSKASFPLESGVTLLEGNNRRSAMRCLPSFLRKLASAFYCDLPAKLPFFSSTAWGCRPKTPLAAPLAGKMSQGYALLTEFSCGKLAVFSSKLTKFSQIGSPEAFLGEIRAHVARLVRFRAKFALKLVRSARFWAKFALILSSSAHSGQNLLSFCFAWCVFRQNLLSFCVARRVLSQIFNLHRRLRPAYEFLFARTARILSQGFALLTEFSCGKLVGVLKKHENSRCFRFQSK